MDVLPDDVLLEIFHLYLYMRRSYGGKPGIEAWQSLVHVCRRWRNLVFQSPRHLNLQLYCGPKTRARDTLDVWPALPLIIAGNMIFSPGTDGVIAALGQSNRVCQVDLAARGLKLEKILVAMQAPFPELTYLRLWSDGETLPVIPDPFLGGSAPRLRELELSDIPFPGLPKLLLSANHLVHLRLFNIPHSGYISPEAMAALLPALSSLETLSLKFQSPQSRPDLESRSMPPPTRSFLPALSQFHFYGVAAYLEDLVTFIDAPQLNHFYINFFYQINFDTPRLAQFINRTPKLRKRDVHVQFYHSSARVELPVESGTLEINISCKKPDRQLSTIQQVCNSSLHPISMVEDLYVERPYSLLVWENDAIDDTLWLQLLFPFTTVKNLYLSEELAPGIAAALQELVGSRITAVLPSLQNIFVEGLESSGPLQENIGQFVAARQLSGHPIAIFTHSKSMRR